MPDKSPEEKVVERIQDLRLSLKSMAKQPSIDSRKLLSIIESELVPSLLSTARFSIAQAAYVEETLQELGERVDDLEEPETQIRPDDAQRLLVHLAAVAELIGGLLQQSPGNEPLKALFVNNEQAIAAVRAATITVDDDDDEEGDDDEEDEGDDEEDGDDDSESE